MTDATMLPAEFHHAFYIGQATDGTWFAFVLLSPHDCRPAGSGHATRDDAYKSAIQTAESLDL